MTSIVVLVAMEAELLHLRSHADYPAERLASRLAARDVWRLEIEGHDVHAIRSGIGMLNAAATTEWAIATFAPEIALNFGCAGAHRRDVMPGDVIIGAQTVNTGALNVLRDGSEAHNGRGYEVAGERIYPALIDADPGLIEIANSVANTNPIEPWPNGLMWPPTIPWRNQQYHTGVISSSEIWTQQLDRLDVLHARHDSLCEDNESAAYAHVAYIHAVPFLAIRDIANNEYHAASDLVEFSDFPTHEVGKRAASLIAGLIAKLP